MRTVVAPAAMKMPKIVPLYRKEIPDLSSETGRSMCVDKLNMQHAFAHTYAKSCEKSSSRFRDSDEIRAPNRSLNDKSRREQSAASRETLTVRRKPLISRYHLLYNTPLYTIATDALRKK